MSGDENQSGPSDVKEGANSKTATPTRAIIALIVVNAMWGTSFPLMKSLNMEIDHHFGVTGEAVASSWLRIASAAWMIGIRFALATILFAVVFRRIIRTLDKAHFWAGTQIGGLFCCGLILQVIGLGMIPASRSGFLTSLAVIFTPIVNAVYQRKAPRLVVIAGALIAVLGISVLTSLIVYQDGRIEIAEDAVGRWTLGDTLTTIGAFIFSFQILSVDRLGKKLNSLAFTPSMFLTTSVLSLIVFAIVQPQIPETSELGWLAISMNPSFVVLIALLVVFASLLAFSWMNKYQPAVSAEQAAVVYTTEPLFASSWALFLPAYLSVWCGIKYANEAFTLPMMVGGALILIANVVVLWPEKKANTGGTVTG